MFCLWHLNLSDLIKVRIFLKTQCISWSKGIVLTTAKTWINSVDLKVFLSAKSEKMTLNRSAREIRRSGKKYKSFFLTLNHLSVRSKHKKYIFLHGDRETRKIWQISERGVQYPLKMTKLALKCRLIHFILLSISRYVRITY